VGKAPEVLARLEISVDGLRTVWVRSSLLARTIEWRVNGDSRTGGLAMTIGQRVVLFAAAVVLLIAVGLALAPSPYTGG